MTAAEQAQELYDECLDAIKGLEGSEWFESAKQCALIAVRNTIKHSPRQPSDYFSPLPHFEAVKYWQEVETEITKL